MLQRLGIRGKILAVVAVPILVLVLAAGFITFGSVQELNQARNSEALIDTLDRARALEENLQDERYASATFLHVIQDSENKLDEAYGFTDTALDNIEARLAVLTDDGYEDADVIRQQVNTAIAREGGTYLAELRGMDIAPPTEESDGWAVFPTEDEITQMQSGYANARAAIDALDESLSDDLGLGGPLSALGFRLNVESELATTLFTEPLVYVEDMQSAASSVDGGIEGLRGSVAQLDGNEANEQAVEALLAGEEVLGELARIRADARSLALGSVAVTTFYSEFIDTIVSSADDVAVAMTDRELVSAVQAYGDLDELAENIKFEEIVIERLIRAGDFLPGEAAQIRTMTAETDIALAEAQDTVVNISGFDEVPEFGASGSDVAGDAASFNSVRAQVLTGLDASLFTARTADWGSQVQEELAVYEPLREDMWERVESRAGSNSQSALVSTIITTLAIAAVVIVSIVVALVIARRIIGPLRRLTTTATAVRQELPRLVERVAIPGETVDVSEVQIPVESRDEVGLLAEAFNGVNAATLAIAGEQAALRGSISEMFVNVARRDQVLLNRQLSSIDEMERSEDNQETLTKLFALDHLATRMRRNSESLLVLAGIDTGRRLRRPMPLSDVVRTASSEIELYERVQLELDADPAMLGHSALTAAHLFAELLENATVFSDPGTAVVVRTAERGGEYVVEIEDSGIGMTEKELSDANNRVASTAASEILGAQRLGLFVVGRIARRIGAHVEIRSEEGAGTLAIVTMPRALFAKEDGQAPHHVSSNVIDESAHAPAALVSHDEAEEIHDTTRLPERSGARADAYSPSALQEGASLSGRSGPEQPAPDSIDALIAADAANAPVAEQTNPQDLTSGSAASGLPTRRRREAAAPADEQREKQSIVGLPARATDAQLSALAAEQAGGFMPSVAPSEVAPQTLEQRSSMFRGFRSRRDNEEEAASTTASPSFSPELPKRGADDQPAAASAPEPAVSPSAQAPAGPQAAPQTESPVRPQATPAPSAPSYGSVGGAAGAAGAAAFFSRRSREEAEKSAQTGQIPRIDEPIRHEQPVQPVQPEQTEQWAQTAQPEQSVEAERAAAPAFEPDFDFSAAPLAGQDVAAHEPQAPHEQSIAPAVEEPAAEAPDSQQSAPEPTENDGLPVFRMPKLDISMPSTPTSSSAPATDDAPAPQGTPGLEPERSYGESPASGDDDAFATGDIPAQRADHGPFVVPSLEADEDEQAAPMFGAEAPAFDAPSEPAAPVFEDEHSAPSYEAQDAAPALESDPSPYGGVDRVSLVEDDVPHAPSPYATPSADHAPSPYAAPSAGEAAAPPGAYGRRWYDQAPPQGASAPQAPSAPGFLAAPGQAGYDAPQADEQSAAPEYAEPEYAEPEYAAQQTPAYEEPPAPQAPAEPAPVETQAATPATPWGFQGDSTPDRRQPNPSLDALIQSAVDDETEQRPGFFSRLFGRGRSGDSTPKAAASAPSSGAPAQWAATDAPMSAPSAPPAPVGGGFGPVADRAPAAPSWRSAPETASAAAPTPYSAPSAPAPAPEAAPASFAPDPAHDRPAQPQRDAASDAPWLQPSAHSTALEEEPRRWETPPWEKPRTDESSAQSAYGDPQGFQPDAGASSAPAWDSSQTAPETQSPSATAFTPDQLAKPAGWEAAGASALQAAQPEGGTSYQPVIQPESGEDGDGGGDITSAVFSELSSLSAERPKVEKTRAGLQRRRSTDAKPVEVRPIEEDVSLAPAERDADAVRSRFSSFYSGTQRARDDVASFAHQSEPAEASDT